MRALAKTASEQEDRDDLNDGADELDAAVLEYLNSGETNAIFGMLKANAQAHSILIRHRVKQRDVA